MGLWPDPVQSLLMFLSCSTMVDPMMLPPWPLQVATTEDCFWFHIAEENL